MVYTDIYNGRGYIIINYLMCIYMTDTKYNKNRYLNVKSIHFSFHSESLY